MKYQIRKCEEITIWQTTEVVNLDPDAFKDLEDNPYTGSSEEDFLTYIAGFVDSCRWDGFPDDLDSDVSDELNKLIDNVKWTEYSNSAEKGENSWLEIGEQDDSYHRTGGFNSHFNTIEKYS